MTFTIPQSEVQILTGLCADALAMYFLSPNQIFVRIPVNGRTLQVKRPWHGDAEMRGAFL
jgi:hypothetical protein